MSFPSPVTVAHVDSARNRSFAGIKQAGKIVDPKDVRRTVEFALGFTHVKELPHIDKMAARIILNEVERQLDLLFGPDKKKARGKMPARLLVRYDATVAYVHGPQQADTSTANKSANGKKGNRPVKPAEKVNRAIDDEIANAGIEEGPRLDKAAQETLDLLRSIKPRKQGKRRAPVSNGS